MTRKRDRELQGSACVPHAGERVLAIANFSFPFLRLGDHASLKRLFRRDYETGARDACATLISCAPELRRDFAADENFSLTTLALAATAFAQSPGNVRSHSKT